MSRHRVREIHQRIISLIFFNIFVNFLLSTSNPAILDWEATKIFPEEVFSFCFLEGPTSRLYLQTSSKSLNLVYPRQELSSILMINYRFKNVLFKVYFYLKHERVAVFPICILLQTKKVFQSPFD